MNKILYFIVGSAFLGARLFSIDIRIMQLSLYRLSMFAVTFYLLLNDFLLDKKFSIRIKDRQSLIIRFYLFWLIYCIYSLSWVLDLRLAVKAIFFIGTGFLCIWIFSTFIKTEKTFKGIFNTMFFMILFHNVLAWFELQTGRYFFADMKKIDRYNQFSFNRAARVPVTTFSNQNDFATLMTFGVFICIVVFLNTKKLSMKVLSSVTLLSVLLLVYRSGSRANMVGVMLGIAAIVAIMLFKRVNKIVFLGLGFLGLMFVMLYPPLGGRIIAIVQNKIFSYFGTKSMSVESDMTRFNLIKNALVFLFSTIGFGTGAGNIEYWMQQRAVYDVGTIINVHNWWVEILVAYGVVIFFAYIAIYTIKVSTLYTAYMKSKDKFIKNTSLALFGFMIAFIISSVSSSSNINTEWLWMFWGVLISFIGYILKYFKLQEGVKKIWNY